MKISENVSRRIPVYWGKTLNPEVIEPLSFERRRCLHLQGSTSARFDSWRRSQYCPKKSRDSVTAWHSVLSQQKGILYDASQNFRIVVGRLAENLTCNPAKKRPKCWLLGLNLYALLWCSCLWKLHSTAMYRPRQGFLKLGGTMPCSWIST
jgi:hypothetical protein